MAAPVEKAQKSSSDQVKRRRVLKWRERQSAPAEEAFAVEEPLEIRLGGQRFTLTMRTPGHDEELATGFLFAEGFIGSRTEIDEIRRARPRRSDAGENRIDVVLKVPSSQLRERLARNFAISSSCGVCGKTSIEALRRRIEPIRSAATIAPVVLLILPARMRETQGVFAATGGLHAAAVFDLNGEMRVIREDVGRHNAVDKVIGYSLMQDTIPLSDCVLMVSGRASFEIVQKAAAAGIPIVAAVSAPTSLAVELADEVGITLVGFLRDSGFNVYTHPDRVRAWLF